MRLTNYFIKKKVQSLASGAAGRKHEFCACLLYTSPSPRD